MLDVFIVFECVKCGHEVRVRNTADLLRQSGESGNLRCPCCGEESDKNWVCRGARQELFVQKGGSSDGSKQ